MKSAANALFLLLLGCGQSEPQASVEPETSTPEPETAAPEPETAAPQTAPPATAAPQTAAPATAAAPAKTAKVRRAPVVVYQASWCQPCHALSAHLTRRGVRHVNKDIDNTPGANDEMNRKLERAGRAGAQLPVMDFRGRIVVGYDPANIDRLCDADLAGAG